MRLPRLVHNRVSYVGAAIASLALVVFLFLLALHTFTDAAHAPYAALVIFTAPPAFLLFGLFLILLGALREWRYVRRTGRRSIGRFPVINLNDPRHAAGAGIFIGGSILLLFLSAFGSFKVYEATESVAFCGTLCHSVMAPEYTAYQNSPHARVRCVDCHVGSGAQWYVKSKLSGAYQVYAVLFDKFPRPIPAPIDSLRPAQETCEQCHWPENFFQAQQKGLVHFLPDEQNTRWQIDLLIKTGGGSRATPQAGGIHWHMNIDNRLDYIATDETRQTIPWVRVTNRSTGVVTTYSATDSPLSAADLAKATIRTLDCMDCHNRPSHIYRSPAYSVNLAMAAGTIAPTLPFIKRTAVELLAAEYASTGAALQAIDDGVTKFYREQYPLVLSEQHDAVTGAVAELQAIYRRNFFPSMNVRWDKYADNIGHLLSAGCFRCHDDQHKSADGKAISKSCTQCHTIIAQGKPPALTFSTEPNGLAFEHPEDIGDMWRETACHECHKGVTP